MNLGLTLGPNLGLLLGLNPASLEGLALLNSVSPFEWDNLWLGNGTDVGPDGDNLTLQTGATADVAVSGLKAGFSQVAIETTTESSTAAADASDSTVGDPAQSVCGFFLMKLGATNPTASRSIGGKRVKSGLFEGYEVVGFPSAGEGRLRFTFDNGASSFNLDLADDHFDDDVHVATFLIDRNALQVSFASDLIATVSSAFTSGSESNTEVFTIFQHRLNSIIGQMIACGLARGAKVEGTDLDALATAIRGLVV